MKRGLFSFLAKIAPFEAKEAKAKGIDKGRDYIYIRGHFSLPHFF
jgi:hypothetical protein